MGGLERNLPDNSIFVADFLAWYEKAGTVVPTLHYLLWKVKEIALRPVLEKTKLVDVLSTELLTKKTFVFCIDRVRPASVSGTW